jgi:D-glycero-D-manno-heptose 1,7-bisphosphate phosphatase
MSRPAIFLDRDGVLVEEIYYPATGEWEAPLGPEDLRLIPHSAAAARRLSEAGFGLVLVSNQAAFAKGKTSLRALWLAHERFVDLLAAEGVGLVDAFYAYGHPQGIVEHFTGPSLDRKPGSYNLFIAAARHDVDLARSWMVGDRETDIACARGAGVRAILLDNPHASPSPSYHGMRARDLREAASLILEAGAVTDLPAFAERSGP